MTERASTSAVVGALLVLALAGFSRFFNLRHGLPDVLGADDHVVLERAQQLVHANLPKDYDWPTGAMLLLAGWLKLTGAADLGAPYGTGRVLFGIVSFLQVLAVGALATAVARPARRLAVASVAMLAVVVSYPLLRTGRLLHPDPLQGLFVTLALLAAVRLVRTPRPRLALAAGLCAGLAAGTKYLGGVVAVAVVAAVLLSPLPRAARKVGYIALAGFSAIAGFLVSVPAMVVDPEHVFDGLGFQLDHQSTSHLGYAGEGSSFLWHLNVALPGTWGWPFTLFSVFAVGWLAWKGTTAQRVVVIHIVVGFAVVAWGVVRFPHYVLVYLPALAVIGAMAFDELAERVADRLNHPDNDVGRLTRATMHGCVVVLLFATPLSHGLRLFRAESARDTRVVAADIAAQIEGPLVKELYTDASDLGVPINRAGDRPDLVTCGCTVEISSYNEDRYRSDPENYADEIAVYDALRQEGRIIAVVAPSRPSSYRWDVLPQWGLDQIPLFGAVGDVGPTITFIELPPPG